MKAKLFFASTVTLGILVGMVGTVLALALYMGDMMSAPSVIGLTVFFVVLGWLVSPWITDRMHKWFYDVEFLSFEDFARRVPQVAEFVARVCAKHSMKTPAIRLINDMNPTAYCYGSASWNARMAVTKGLFHYLDEGEVQAVVAHELGHIVNKDFIVMTIAATLLQILYELYVIFYRNRRRSGRKDPTPFLGLISYVFWWFGTYLILYLSRTREYAADAFSAEETGDPNLLSMGLVKIAYGIAAAPDTAASNRLLASTRALGIYDFKSANASGSVFSLVAEAPPDQRLSSLRRIEKVFLFDLFNPWAKVAELSSTHPLTGRRIQALCEICPEQGKLPLFQFEKLDAAGKALEMSRIWGKFFFEVFVYFAPILSVAAALIMAVAIGLSPQLSGGVCILFLGLAMLCKGLYRYPSLAHIEKTSIFDLMCDPYASPLRGRPVEVSGRIIGRAAAGASYGEDMMMQDSSGGLVMLNYESWLPLIGNLLFGWKRTKTLIGQPASARGWFLRSIGHWIDLNRLEAEGEMFSSYNRFQGIVLGLIVTVIGILSIQLFR